MYHRFLLLTLVAAVPALAASCDSLTSLTLPDTTITSAQTVTAGQFSPPQGRGGTPNAAAFQDLPAFCRVAATLKPTSDSDIKIEVWMPAAGWNGKFQGVGNGGWAGSISYRELGEALGRGYATASTDTGHTGGSGQFALGHPEKLIDFGYRSEHEMTVKAKAIISAFYGNAPKYSYWNGCSTGGRQGLKEAQRFPDDYDGIIAGAAANPRTHLSAGTLWIAAATLKDPASYIPREKYAVIHRAVLDACDALDGVKDGVIEDPTSCQFDPKVLQCKGEDAPGCLTAPQVEAARKIYTPVTSPSKGTEIFPALEPGSELGWGVLAGGPAPFAPIVDHFKYVVYKDPDWDWRTFDIDRDTARADEVDKNTINATNPHLAAFFNHGGKLLMYHGWSDQNVAPLASVNYYRSVVGVMGQAETADSMRLFMAPGMAHCGGGDGPNVLETVGALEQWVEKGKAPNQVLASRLNNGTVERTRPLCPFPQVAQYKGSGSTDDAKNFVCKE